MLKFRDISVLQLEITNLCNAACPQCPRNYFGGRTIPTLPLKSWSLQEFKKIFTVEFLGQLSQVYFCGTYGDPMANKDLLEMCLFLKQGNPEIEIGIHTNGGIGYPHVYQKLAKYVDFIAFGIDGLEDSNHIYRRNIKWHRVIENANSFIKAGGKAIWDFIVFQHNQHQVETARDLSKQYGFHQFNVKKTGRFLDRKHEFKDYLPVYDKSGFIDYTIALPDNKKYVNEQYTIMQNGMARYESMAHYAKSTCIKCNANRISEIYIGADGFVFPCGWLHDRLYGPEVENHADHFTVKKLMAQAGGLVNTNIFHAPLEKIIDGGWFDIIEKSWTNDDRLERCGMMCGDTINLIRAQNTEITYKK
jgi:MoaA/NifB/PqqE/SkfB family radical SAM enzyme